MLLYSRKCCVHRCSTDMKSTRCRFLRYYAGAVRTGLLRTGGALPRARPLTLAALELRGLGPHTACRVTLLQRPPAPPAGASPDGDLLPPPALEHEALEYRALPLACATAVADSGGRAAVPLQACAVQGDLKVEVRGRLLTDLRRGAHCVGPSSSARPCGQGPASTAARALRMRAAWLCSPGLVRGSGPVLSSGACGPHTTRPAWPAQVEQEALGRRLPLFYAWVSTAFLGPGECVLPRCELDKVHEPPLLVHLDDFTSFLLCLSVCSWQASVHLEAYEVFSHQSLMSLRRFTAAGSKLECRCPKCQLSSG
jgi:hypothetical protein